MIRNLQIFAGSEAGLEASLPYLDLALALDAFNTSLLLERASTRLRMGLRDDAKKDFKTLLELLPADDSAESIRELYNTPDDHGKWPFYQTPLDPFTNDPPRYLGW